MMRDVYRLGSMVLMCAALSACASGGLFSGPLFTPEAPDEFSVISTRPLTMPPEFILPTPGAETKAERLRSAADRVDTSLLRGDSTNLSAGDSSDTDISKGESALLKALSTNDEALPDINVKDAKKIKVPQQPYLLQRLMGGDNKEASMVIDPVAERKRIEDAKAEGKTITGDGAIEVKESSEGLLQRLFD